MTRLLGIERVRRWSGEERGADGQRDVVALFGVITSGIIEKLFPSTGD